MEQNLPNIYEYIDIKSYLKAYRLAQKQSDSGFTNTYICHVLGQKNSKGYFNNVVSGRVRIGATLVDRFIKLLQLSGAEEKYFRVLVQYSQASDGAEQERLFEELLRLNRAPSREMDKKRYPYYSRWYHAVIRALLDIYNFDGSDYRRLSQKLITPLSLVEIRKSVALLLDLELIAFNEAGFLKPTEKAITCGKDIEREILLQYQAKNLEQSRNVIANSAISPQKATTMTVSISEEAFDSIKHRIDQMKAEVRMIVQKDSGVAEKLYQINIHLFPQSK